MKIIILITTILLSFTASAQLTQEQRIVAQTILGEARGEGEAGMYAMACVIAQRSIAWGKTPTQVCLKKWQFSCWNPNDPNRARLPQLLDIPQAAYAKRLAVNLTQLQRSYTKNADHYCTLATHPSWSYKKIIKDNKTFKVSIVPVAIIGNHKFYKLR
jgi:spore germination cell wall hydrolase CwlJ-like protein|tara:strand:- start:69 stop:542 length:474 start_codon:yes stop_codon:yes gene_type:complete